MLHPFNTVSFLSLWYWALTALVWLLVTRRALGVPRDMLPRAARLPEVAGRIDILARITAERVDGVARSAGVVLAALAGFGLATLATLGFVFGIEIARALVPLALPLCLVAGMTARLAARVRAERLSGAPLRQALARHGAWTQSIAVLAMFAAALLAVTAQPSFFPR